MSDVIVRQVQGGDEELLEEWQRETDDADLRWVGAARWCDDPAAWPWQVSVAVAELVREEPLESRMRAAVAEALRGVPGVTDVAEEDREVWVVCGTPTGEALVRAVSIAIDGLAADLRAHHDALG